MTISTTQPIGELSRLDHLLQALFNKIITHVPIRALRRTWLRVAGANLADNVTLFCGVQVLGARGLTIGRRCAVGWRTVLDARGVISIGDDVNVASDCQILTADHDMTSPYFDERFAAVRLMDYASVGTRAMILKGVTVHRGGVAAAGAVVVRDIPSATVVGGVPAVRIGTRSEEMLYELGPPPKLA